jgi:hypothetical protein
VLLVMVPTHEQGAEEDRDQQLAALQAKVHLTSITELAVIRRAWLLGS